jgi:hypothetical protein
VRGSSEEEREFSRASPEVEATYIHRDPVVYAANRGCKSTSSAAAPRSGCKIARGVGVGVGLSG